MVSPELNDNFKIHDSRQVQLALAGWDGKVKLHFLPPVLPGSQSYRATLEGPPRQRDPQPLLQEHGGTHEGCLHIPPLPKTTGKTLLSQREDWLSRVSQNHERLFSCVPVSAHMLLTHLFLDFLSIALTREERGFGVGEFGVAAAVAVVLDQTPSPRQVVLHARPRIRWLCLLTSHFPLQTSKQSVRVRWISA